MLVAGVTLRIPHRCSSSKVPEEHTPTRVGHTRKNPDVCRTHPGVCWTHEEACWTHETPCWTHLADPASLFLFQGACLTVDGACPRGLILRRWRVGRQQIEWVERLSHWKWLKPRPESGLDWLICSNFSRQRVRGRRCSDTGESSLLSPAPMVNTVLMLFSLAHGCKCSSLNPQPSNLNSQF